MCWRMYSKWKWCISNFIFSDICSTIRHFTTSFSIIIVCCIIIIIIIITIVCLNRMHFNSKRKIFDDGFPHSFFEQQIKAKNSYLPTLPILLTQLDCCTPLLFVDVVDSSSSQPTSFRIRLRSPNIESL